MGTINAAWHLAMSVIGQNFTKAEQDAGWPELLTYGQLAALQYPYAKGDAAGLRYSYLRATAILKACESGELPHTATTIKKMVSPARMVDTLNRTSMFGVLAKVVYTVPASYKEVTTYAATAPAFAAWLAAQPETPSAHIAAWFEFLGVVVPDAVVAVTPAQDIKKRRERKKAWHIDAMPYMKELYKSGKYKSAAVFYNALLTRAGTEGSPFSKVKNGLFCDKAGTPVAEGTVGTVWADIRDPE